MKCPYCQNEMEPGYIKSNKHIIFTCNDSGLPIPISKKDDIKLTANMISPATCYAWNCRTCQKIIIEYQEDQVKR